MNSIQSNSINKTAGVGVVKSLLNFNVPPPSDALPREAQTRPDVNLEDSLTKTFLGPGPAVAGHRPGCKRPPPLAQIPWDRVANGMKAKLCNWQLAGPLHAIERRVQVGFHVRYQGRCWFLNIHHGPIDEIQLYSTVCQMSVNFLRSARHIQIKKL